jgi:predicted glutamine amidotransferase
MCNLAGYSGPNANPDKIKILLLMGASRGKDSTGLLINNKLFRTGDHNTKAPEDFLSSFNDWGDEPITRVIAHSRKASVGGVSFDNAHPVEVLSEEFESPFYLTHNGTLSDYKELGKKHGYTHKQGDTDTILLAHILSHSFEEDLQILSEYEGDAALAFGWGNNSDVYLWKGAHEVDRWDYYNKHTKGFYEERPLFIFKSPCGGIYWSSEKMPLEVISGGDEDNIIRIASNTLFHYAQGKLINSTKVDRKYKDIQPKKTTSRTTYYGRNPSTVSHSSSYRPSQLKLSPLEELSKTPDNLEIDQLFFKSNKYWVYSHVAPSWASGVYTLLENDRVYKNKNDIPKEFRNLQSTTAYFFKGFWLKDAETYDSFVEDASGEKEVKLSHLHPFALNFTKKPNEKIYHNNTFVIKKDRLIAPFCYFTLKISSGMALGSYYSHPFVRKYNDLHNTNYNLIGQITASLKPGDTIAKVKERTDKEWFTKFMMTQ